MQVSRPKARFVFRNPEQTIRTTSIVKNSINITEQLYNDLHSSSNTCSLQLVDDGSGLIEKIINDNTDVTVLLYDIDAPATSSLFEGILSNDHSWRVSMTGEDVFQIKIEDRSTRYFDKPFVDYDGTCVRDSLYNIIQGINRRCIPNTPGVIFDESVTQTIKDKLLVNKVNSNQTCKEVLDQICYEFGLVYYFKNGQLHIKKTPDLSSSPVTTIGTTADSATQFTPDHYLYEEGGSGIDLTRKARQYSQTKVTYGTISDSTSLTTLYEVTENIDVPAGGWWDGTPHTENIYEPTLDEYFLAEKKYYLYNSGYEEATIYPASDTDPTHTPKVGDLVPNSPVYYEYAGQSSLIDMSDIARGKDILYVYPDTVTPNTTQTTGVPGYVEKQETTPSTWTIKQHQNTDKLEILIDNTQGGISSIYSKFKCAGRIIRKTGTSNIYRSLTGITGNSETQYNYEAQWLHDKNDAIALAELLSHYYLYCDNTYTFYCKDDLELGSIVRVYENVYSGLDVNMLLVAKQYTSYGDYAGVYKYTAQGISAFDLTSTTRVERYEAPQESPSMVNVSVKYALADQGTDPTLIPATDWQDTIPSGSAGEYIWTWTHYVYSDSSVQDEYSASFIGDQTFEFELSVTPDTYSKNYRSDSNQLYRISTRISGYTGTPTITVWFSSESTYDNPYTQVNATSLNLSIPMNKDVTGYMRIRAELTGAPSRDMFLPIVDETITYLYIGEVSVDTSSYFDSDGNLIPENYSQIDWSAVNNAYNLKISDMHFWFHNILVEGDSFFNNYKDQNTGFEDCLVYVWNQEKWVPINYSTFSNSERSKILAQAQKDVLSTIEPGTVTKSDFGYFNTIIAGTVTANYIGSKEIELHDGGFLYGGDVDLTQPAGQRLNTSSPGFCFDSEGNGELSNIRITGMSTVEGQSNVLGTMTNYDANGELVFKTVKQTTNSATMSGSKQDGTDAPSAYQWKEFHDWLQTQILNNATSGTYYNASGQLRGTWSGSTVDGRTISGIKYWSSLPPAQGRTVNGDKPSDEYEKKVMYTNPDGNWVKFSHIFIHPKSMANWTGVSIIWARFNCKSYYQNGTLYRTIAYSNEDVKGLYGKGDVSVDNVLVPPHGYIEVEAFACDNWWYSELEATVYLQFSYSEADNFSTGINLIDGNGYVYAYDSVIPNTNGYAQGYSQNLTCNGLNLQFDMQFTAASNWPITKYYNFQYIQSPGTTQTVTTSIFTSQSFTYNGIRYTVASITYDNSNLKVTTTLGNNFEFTNGTSNYYQQYSFNFVAAAESLGAYARTFLPTDDPNRHDIGGSGSYDSGASQRWHNGFFELVDANRFLGSWVVPIVTGNYTVRDMVVGTMRPVFINSSSTVSLTMPGDSSQQYVIMSNNVIDASASAGKNPHYELVNGGASQSISWTSSAEPYILVYVIRIQ